MGKISLVELLKLQREDLINKVIVFPTDTVYALACLYGDNQSKEKIYEIKKRDHLKKLPVLCSDIKQVESICILKNKKYVQHWPGALTMILKTKDEQDTLGVRIPNSNVALQILNHFGPLYATSVNLSNEKEINDVKEIENKFNVDYIVDEKAVFSSIPSTVIDLTTDTVKVLRQGAINIYE